MIHVVVMKCLIGLPLLVYIELLWVVGARVGVGSFKNRGVGDRVGIGSFKNRGVGVGAFVCRLHSPAFFFRVSPLLSHRTYTLLESPGLPVIRQVLSIVTCLSRTCSLTCSLITTTWYFNEKLARLRTAPPLRFGYHVAHSNTRMRVKCWHWHRNCVWCM
jgi:hypothetical protein